MAVLSEEIRDGRWGGLELPVDNVDAGATFDLTCHISERVSAEKICKADSHVEEMANLRLESDGQEGITAD